MKASLRIKELGLTPSFVMELCGQYAAEKLQREHTPLIDDSKVGQTLFRNYLSGRSEETFAAAFLDTRHRIIKMKVLFTGTIDGAAVYPRVVAERCLRYGAAAVLVAHNHPSGVCEPSLADQAITRRLKDALALLDIRLLDHFVVAGENVCSMATRGML